MHIGIIGGGFSGVSTAVQLAKQTNKPISITLFNSIYPVAKGVAYSTSHPMHILNVPAGRMSFFPDRPNHFVEWVTKVHSDKFFSFGKSQVEDAFLPRSLYGDYLNSVLNTEIIFNKNINYILVEETAENISGEKEKWRVAVSSGKKFDFDKIILATGNESPEIPSFITDEMIIRKIYSSNPWVTQAEELSNEEETVLLLGTGLSMIDNMLSIFSQGFKGKIVAVSTKGLLPLPSRKSETDLAILTELKRPYDINTVFDIFRKHVHRVRNYGLPGVSVVDALRPLTQEIWKELSIGDKKRFLAHIRQLWGVARHRLPLNIFDAMNSYIYSRRLEITAGRLSNVKLQNSLAEATIKLRATGEEIKLRVQKIINCTGPLLDITKSKSVLIKNLLAQNMISPDELRLGINATEKGNIIMADGKVLMNIFTIGPPLKGVLWESTAIPEIRKQSEELAQRILN